MNYRYVHQRLAAAMLLIIVAAPAFAQMAVVDEPVDTTAIKVIRTQGLEQSQVMETLSWLTDVHGPRLTGSPQLADASQWALETMQSWGLENAHLEPWGPFGLGWSLNRFAMHVTTPVTFPVMAYPQAWSPGTDGTVSAEVVLFDPETEDDFDAFEDKLDGKIVLMQDPRAIKEPFDPIAERKDAEELLDLANAVSTDAGGRRYSEEAMARYRFNQAKSAFLNQQQPLAILELGSPRGDYGSYYVGSASAPPREGASWFDQPKSWDPQGASIIPQISVAAEHYNRIYRLVQKGFPVEIELNLDVNFYDDDPMEYNVIAEIPGTDPEVGDEVVMLGGHLDSWHAGTGATDNASGCAVMMEAARILQETFKELNVQPRRTIRVALWTGEEQGLYGSRAYVNEHFATIQGWSDPPTALKHEHDQLSAYYNLDNGTGKIRGVYLQGNAAVRPIFAAWLAPFHDLGAGTLTISDTGGTDHLPFDQAGLPGFQFIQDPIAYGRTHHTNMDVYDHAEPDDLKQAATIVAAFAYHTAQRDEKLPREPLTLKEDMKETVGGSN